MVVARRVLAVVVARGRSLDMSFLVVPRRLTPGLGIVVGRHCVQSSQRG